MKIHKQEILDGLSEKIEASASVSLDAQILIDSDLDHPSEEEIQRLKDQKYIETFRKKQNKWNLNENQFIPIEIEIQENNSSNLVSPKREHGSEMLINSVQDSEVRPSPETAGDNKLNF